MAPAAVAGMGLAMQIGGAIAGESARSKAAEEQAKGYTYDATVADRNAKLVASQAFDEEAKSRISATRQLGQERANFAASGFKVEGGIMDILQSNASQAEADALNIRRRGQLQSEAYSQEARFDRQKAGYYQQAGQFDWLKVGFQGVGAAAGAYPKIFGNSASTEEEEDPKDIESYGGVPNSTIKDIFGR